MSEVNDTREAFEGRMRSAYSGIEQARRRPDDVSPSLVTIICDALHAIDALAAMSHPAPVSEPVGFVAEVEAERADRDRAKADAFDRIAAFFGVAGLDACAPASELFREVGNIIATVRGVPNPNAEDTAKHYRRVAPGRLSKRQRKLVGLEGVERGASN